MYMDDDTLTPRDRISDDMLRRILDGSDGTTVEHNHMQNQPRQSLPHDKHHSWGLENHPLASMYAPLQEFCNLYDRDTALMRGTVFSELDLPFMGIGVTKGGSCRG